MDTVTLDANRVDAKLSESNLDEAARKRLEIGLAPRRDTARASFDRPPGSADRRARAGLTNTTEQTLTINRPFATVTSDPTGGWWMVVLLALLALATFLLIAARFLQSSTDFGQVRGDLAAISNGRIDLTQLESQSSRLGLSNLLRRVTGKPFLLLSDEFDSDSGRLISDTQVERWIIGTVPTAGVYRMMVWPGSATWSRLGTQSLLNYRLETTARIAADTPNGVIGLAARFIDSDNFYLFSINGRSQYQLQLRQNGAWTLIKPWTTMEAIGPAGQPNLLAVEDAERQTPEGKKLRFWVNGEPIIAVVDFKLPAGDVALWAAAGDAIPVNADFEWLRLTAIQ